MINSVDILAERQFPLSGTYLGTLVDVPEPQTNLADWYHWNQAQMAAHAVRYTVITSDSTKMIQHRRPGNALMTDIYAHPPLAIEKHIPVIAQHIARDTARQLEALGIEYELRPIWLPLGRTALLGVEIAY